MIIVNNEVNFQYQKGKFSLLVRKQSELFIRAKNDICRL